MQVNQPFNKTPYHMAFACFECRKSFKRIVGLTKSCPHKLVCPHCGGTAVNLGRHFKPPKARDTKQWEKVAFLFEHGFHFQKIPVYDPDNLKIIIGSVPYPDTPEQARVFVKQYQRYARHLDSERQR